jgi:hypothetical protein
VIEIVVDCHDPGRLAAFWSALLGIDIRGEVREGNLGRQRVLSDALSGSQRAPADTEELELAGSVAVAG